MDELKECPFCGNPPNTIDVGDGQVEAVCCMAEMMMSGDWNTRPVEDRLRRELAEANRLLDERWLKAWAIIGEDKELLSREERGIGIIHNLDQAEVDELTADLWSSVEDMDLDVPDGAYGVDFLIKDPCYQEGQMSFPETGQYDFLPYWEMDISVLGFQVTLPAEGRA